MRTPRELSRRRLTATLMERQMLIERADLTPVQALPRMAAAQAQYSPSPYIAMWSRLSRFDRAALERALARGLIVKSTLMRTTLHLVTARDYPLFAAAWHDQWRAQWSRRLAAHSIDEGELTGRLRAFAAEPRTTAELRAFVTDSAGDALDADGRFGALEAARALVPLVHVPPSGSWRSHGSWRAVAWPGELPSPEHGAAALARRYLAAFGPAGRKDIARFSGLTLGRVDRALERLEPLRRFRDELGRELLDLPRAPISDPDVDLPARFLPRWDQAVIAYDDRSRILPSELERAAAVPLTGEAVFLLDGLAAGIWRSERAGRRAKLILEPLRDLARAERRRLSDEGTDLMRFVEPDAEHHELAWRDGG